MASPQDRPSRRPVPDDAGGVRVVLGVVVPPQTLAGMVTGLGAELAALLAARVARVEWDVRVVEERLVAPPADSMDLLEAARDRLLDGGWDLAVALTDLPLTDSRRVVRTLASPVHGVGLLSVPALGPVHVRHRLLATTAELVAVLLGRHAGGHEPLSVAAVASRLSPGGAGVEAPDPSVGVVLRTARVLGGNIGVLLGMVRANRPWRLAIGLSRALTVAGATGVLALVTSDLWSLSAAYGPGRLTALGLVSVGAVTLTLILGAGLWERPRRRRERTQVMLFNAATAATVVVGVLVFHAVLFVLSAVGAVLLVDAGVYADVTGEPLDAAALTRLSGMVATLATLGGALGAGLETDDAVRQAAYTSRSTESVEEEAVTSPG